MNRFTLFCNILLFPLIVVAQRPVNYRLPDATLSSEQICGRPKVCDPGPIRGIVYRFNVQPYSPDIDDNSTPQTIAASILGNAVSASENNAEELNICSEDGLNSLITINDITAKGAYGVKGRSFNYNKKKKTTIDSKAAAQANIDELLKASNLDRKLFFDSIRAELEIIYDNLKSSEIIITANYSEWSLKQSTINRIKNSEDFQACRTKLKANNWAYITDISLITYNVSFNGKKIREFGININSKLKREGINVDIGILVERELNKDISSEVEQGYQVIGWRKSPI